MPQSYGPLRLFPSSFAFGEVHTAGFSFASIFSNTTIIIHVFSSSTAGLQETPFQKFFCVSDLYANCFNERADDCFCYRHVFSTSTRETEGTSLDGQRALRLWLELIALFELLIVSHARRVYEV